MKFEIINPSDPYTMEADDMLIAAVAVCLLGNGKYAAKALGTDANDSNDVPVFLFGGHDEWFQSRFGMDYEAAATQALETRNDALARAFESVNLGREKRSSLNDIGGRAQQIAKAIRAKAAEAKAQ